MLKSEKVEWRRARSIAYFSDLKINRTEDLEYTYTVKHLVQLYSDYKASLSFIKKEKEDLLADKDEYINAINDLKKIVDDNLSSNEKTDLWANLKQVLEKGYDDDVQQNADNNVPENI